jgi:hypothetical protein
MGSVWWTEGQRYRGELLFIFIHQARVDHLPSQIHLYNDSGFARQSWALIPIKPESVSAPLPPSSVTLGSDPLPPYDGNQTGQSPAPTRTQHSADLTRDDFGTKVTEVTTITTSRR